MAQEEECRTTDLEVLSSNLFCELLFCFIFILFFIRLVSLKHYTRGGESDCFVILKTLIWDFLQEILFVALGCCTRCVWSTFLSLCPTTLGSAYDDICQHRYYIFGNPENRTLGSWVRSTNLCAVPPPLSYFIIETFANSAVASIRRPFMRCSAARRRPWPS